MAVVVVEDDEELLQGLVDLLKEEGYLVKPARSLEELEQYSPDHSDTVLLLDVWLNGRRSDEWWLLKGKERWPKRPRLILMSGTENMVDLQSQTGADDYLEKPFNSLHLFALLNKYN